MDYAEICKCNYDVYEHYDRLENLCQLVQSGPYQHHMMFPSGKTDIFDYNAGLLFVTTGISVRGVEGEKMFCLRLDILTLDDGSFNARGKLQTLQECIDEYPALLEVIKLWRTDWGWIPRISTINAQLGRLGMYGECF